MSAARTARRRRKQAMLGHTHMAKLSPHQGCSRPIYHRPQLLSVGEAIQRERSRAAAEAKRKQAKK